MKRDRNGEREEDILREERDEAREFKKETRKSRRLGNLVIKEEREIGRKDEEKSRNRGITGGIKK